MTRQTMITSKQASLVGFLLLALGITGCGGGEVEEQAPVARPVKTVVVGGGGEVERSLPGRVHASNQVDLSFRVGGPLIEFPAREGATVAKDELLARIDPRDYEIKLNMAMATREKSEADYQRMTALYEKDAVSKAQLDQAKAARDVARAAVDDAEAQLADTELRAPFAARVGETFVENFQDVRPKESILSLVDVDAVEIEVDVPETRVARFRGEPGRIAARFDSAPGREFELTVKEVAAQADPVTQTFRATLTMPQPEGINLLPGMTATVIGFRSDGADGDVVVIPAIAVFADETGASHVWVVDAEANSVHRRPIRTGGLRGSDRIEVVEGLRPGEVIAVSAVTQLREGMAIRPIDEVRSR